MMRYTSGDLCINWSEAPAPMPEFFTVRGSIVTKFGEHVWTVSHMHCPSFWSPKRVAQEILDWAANGLLSDTILALADVDNTFANETRFAVKEAA